MTLLFATFVVFLAAGLPARAADLAASPSQINTNDAEALESTVRHFVKALENDDLDTLYRSLSCADEVSRADYHYEYGFMLESFMAYLELHGLLDTDVTGTQVEVRDVINGRGDARIVFERMPEQPTTMSSWRPWKLVDGRWLLHCSGDDPYSRWLVLSEDMALLLEAAVALEARKSPSDTNVANVADALEPAVFWLAVATWAGELNEMRRGLTCGDEVSLEDVYVDRMIMFNAFYEWHELSDDEIRMTGVEVRSVLDGRADARVVFERVTGGPVPESAWRPWILVEGRWLLLCSGNDLHSRWIILTAD